MQSYTTRQTFYAFVQDKETKSRNHCPQLLNVTNEKLHCFSTVSYSPSKVQNVHHENLPETLELIKHKQVSDNTKYDLPSTIKLSMACYQSCLKRKLITIAKSVDAVSSQLSSSQIHNISTSEHNTCNKIYYYTKKVN